MDIASMRSIVLPFILEVDIEFLHDAGEDGDRCEQDDECHNGQVKWHTQHLAVGQPVMHRRWENDSEHDDEEESDNYADLVRR